MRNFIHSLLILASGSLIAGCAPQAKLQSDVDHMQSGLSDVRSIQAEQVAQIDSMRAELRALSGRLEELEHSQKTTIGSDISAVREDLSQLKRRVPPPAIVPADELEMDEQQATSLSQDVSGKVSDGLQKLREGKFSGAQALFEELYDAQHDGDAAPIILFWLAISEEGLNDNGRAVRHYAELISRFPKSKRAPMALLRQGSVLIRLGDSKAASFAFKKLVADYPRAPEVERAKARLKELH